MDDPPFVCVAGRWIVHVPGSISATSERLEEAEIGEDIGLTDGDESVT